MMHQEHFVVSIKSGDKYLRDENGVVKIPFDSDYEIFLKNLESRPAVVKVSIDGKDVLDGKQLIVNGNAKILLQGFLDGNTANRKFKFIELTKEVEKDMPYSPEDSIIRVEVKYQKNKPITQEIRTIHHRIYKPEWDWWYYWHPAVYTNVPTDYPYTLTWNDSNGVHTSSYNTRSGNIQNTTGDTVGCYSLTSSNYSFSSNDVGKTVKGDKCNQEFSNGYLGDLEEDSQVLILRLSGYREDNQKVETLTTNKDKIYCPECGKANNVSHKYCTDCGHSLTGI